MATVQLCPTDDVLRRLMQGTYTGPDADAVGQHFLTCPACGEKAALLVTNDALLKDLRAANDTSRVSMDGTFQEDLIRRVNGEATGPYTPRGADVAFLRPPMREYPADLGSLGKYRVLKKLGQGGMGMVFLAIDPTLERTLALKVILPQFAANERLRDRFLEEARATIKVRSPHVAEVYECDVAGDVPYLTMELLIGKTLDEKKKPMAVTAWRSIAYGIAKGLADAHRANMIHRDLKPSNVHLGTDARTGKPTVKIIDFGLARPLHREIERTRSGEILGTPAYMSPEQARGAKVDPRTDLYSLGVILYQLATGRLPYLSAQEGGIYAVLAELGTPAPLPPVRNLAPNLPPILATLIDQLLSKDAAHRPATAEAVMKTLKASLSTEAVPEAETSSPYLSIPDAESPPTPAPSTVKLNTVTIARRVEPPPLTVARRVEPVEPEAAVSTRSRTKRRKKAQPERGGKPPWFWPAVGVGVPALALLLALALGAFKSKPGGDAKNLPPDVGQPNGVHPAVAAGPDAPPLPRANWAEMTNLIEVVPKWQAVDPTLGGKIKAARELTVKDVKQYEYTDLVQHMMMLTRGPGTPGGFGGPPMFNPNQPQPPKLQVPNQLLITGDLAGIRTSNDRVWVMLATPRVFGPFPPGGVLAEFNNPKMVAMLADFRVGERVRMLVTRNPRDELKPLVNPNAPADARELLLEKRFVKTNFTYLEYWAFKGEAIEKSNQNNTWIDVKDGRAETLTNGEAYARSPTNLLRDQPGSIGVKGRVVGSYVSYTKVANELIVSLRLDNTAEGYVNVAANLGPFAAAEELLDYTPGDTVEAEVVTTAPPARGQVIMTGPTPGPAAESFTLDAVLTVNAVRLQKLNNPATLIGSSGPRRPVALPDVIAPDVVKASPEKCNGRPVTWTGKLTRIRVLTGGTHLLVTLGTPVNGVRSFEAFAPDKDFLAELDDYRTDDEVSTAQTDTVIVKGTAALPDATAARLDKDVPLARILSVERPNDLPSLATVGAKRAANTFRVGKARDELTQLTRNMPPVGTELKLQVRYESFASYSNEVSLRPADKIITATVKGKLAAATEANLSDYQRDDLVEIVAVVEAEGSAAGLKLRLKSIVRTANPRSLVTEAGRAIPPLDFTKDYETYTKSRTDRTNTAQPLPISGGGVYDGYKVAGNELKVTLKKAFFKTSTFDATCADTPANRKALDALKVGDEILFDGTMQPTMRVIRPVTIDSFAPIGDPTKKVALKP